MSSTEECQSEFNAERTTFESVAYFSLSLTLLSLIVRTCFEQHLISNPKHGWLFFFTLGAIKIVLGILLFTVFSPTCPTGCICGNGTYHPSYIYPILVTTLGVIWILRGKKFYELDQNGPPSDPNFGAVPGTEMAKSDIV